MSIPRKHALRRLHPLLMVCLLGVGSGAAQHTDVRLDGVLVVLNCRQASIQVIAGNPSGGEVRLARDCAKMGAPMAILVGVQENYVLYTLSVSPPMLIDYLGKKVAVRGKEIAPRVVLPEHIAAEVDSGWIDVPTTSVM